MGRKCTETCGPIKADASIIKESIGRMVDIDKNCVEAAFGFVRIEPSFASGHGKEVALN